jgi:hypothetical protein
LVLVGGGAGWYGTLQPESIDYRIGCVVVDLHVMVMCGKSAPLACLPAAYHD